MAVIYDLYRTPTPDDKKDRVSYHARPVTYGTVDTEEISAEISKGCSLHPADVAAALEALSSIVGQHLRAGHRVHLNGIGYFQISLACEEQRSDKGKQSFKVKMKNIGFRADKKFRSEVRTGIEFELSKFKNHSDRLSSSEVDALLTAYFAEHPNITRLQFEELCGLKQNTAYRHIKRLLAENKLQNIGYGTHPIYTLVTE